MECLNITASVCIDCVKGQFLNQEEKMQTVANNF